MEDKLNQYLLDQLERRKKMDSPEYQKSMREDRSAEAAASDRNALAALLAKSAAGAGTLGGKAADAELVSEMAKNLQVGNRQFYSGLDQERQDAESRFSNNAKLAQYLAERKERQAAAEAHGRERESLIADKKLAADENSRRWREEMELKRKALEQEQANKSRDFELRAEENRSKKPGETPAERKTVQEADYRYNMLKQNAEKLKNIIRTTGTTEVTGPAGSEMDRLVYEMAIDYAKMVDPDSVAREGEVAAAQKYMLPFRESFLGIGPRGMGTRNETAISQVDNYVKALDDRLASRAMAKAGEKYGEISEKTGGAGTAVASPSEEKIIKGKRYKRVPGGWQEVK